MCRGFRPKYCSNMSQPEISVSLNSHFLHKNSFWRPQCHFFLFSQWVHSLDEKQKNWMGRRNPHTNAGSAFKCFGLIYDLLPGDIIERERVKCNSMRRFIVSAAKSKNEWNLVSDISASATALGGFMVSIDYLMALIERRLIHKNWHLQSDRCRVC